MKSQSIINTVKHGFLAAFFLTLPALAVAAGGDVHLDKAPVNLNNHESLQRGAKLFVNYCLNCHSANYMRYNRLVDIGLTEEQIKNNLLFAADKVGETMQVTMPKAEAKAWFGVVPPDLTVEARARTADWLYTYLRGFYRDDSRPTGWNNVAFANVGMPHVLWELQGQQVMKTEEHVAADGTKTESHHLALDKPGVMTPAEYDVAMADLVNYLVFMAEPAQVQRKKLGVIVLLFLGLLFVVSYYLKKEFWKDVH
ncbi:MAG: cytochrome c1 [Betaproteobacteria bacterium HGW-Betaproteobacteria-1]|jgi:ubiquinol-cytochrome c reductase cytochrome c1 subunit|nr:MAG: cytochrome c1 [Betaproteobacteria bacterium HGW-Betaproteobacteria-1]